MSSPRMSLVHHDDAVSRKERVCLDFLEEDTVSHDGDSRVFVRLVYESHLIADETGDLGAVLPRDIVGNGDCGDPPRLRNPDDAVPG